MKPSQLGIIRLMQFLNWQSIASENRKQYEYPGKFQIDNFEEKFT